MNLGTEVGRSVNWGGVWRGEEEPVPPSNILLSNHSFLLATELKKRKWKKWGDIGVYVH